jgi:hypothetical protein
MSTPPFEPINSGQEFPKGTATKEGRCMRCGAHRQVALMRQSTPFGREDIRVCAECMADCLVGAETTGIGTIELWDGARWRFVRTQ